MDLYLDTHIEFYLIPLANKALQTLEDPTPDNTIVTSSAGNTVTIIPKNEDYVLQVFRSPDRYRIVKSFWNRTADDCSARMGLAQILDFDDDKYMIKVQKVVPLNKFGVGISVDIGVDINKISSDISHTINHLGENGVIHGDTRLDNVGWYKDRYVLYDFDSVKVDVSVTEIEHEHDVLQSSINFITQEVADD